MPHSRGLPEGSDLGHWAQRRTRVSVALIALVAGIVGAATARSAAHSATESQAPYLLPRPQRTIERSNPPVVNAILERTQRAARDEAMAAAKLKRTVAGGCVPVAAPWRKPDFGPPSPTFTARVIGHQVEVSFEYAHLPTSSACRPRTLTVVVYSGELASTTFNNAGAVGTYELRGPRGRTTVDLPWGGRAPFHVQVTSETLLGFRGAEGRRPLACPAAGCLPGYQPTQHAWTLPLPVLPLRGLNRSELAASLRYVVAGETWTTAKGASCSSLRSCTVTLVTPGFPNYPYRVRYRMAGQQVPGCWMGMSAGAIDTLPYRDPGLGPVELSGCASWVS